MEPGILFQILIWGFITSCIYILLATGLNLIFGVMKIVNFAHGELMVLGVYATFWITRLVSINPYSSILISMAVMMLLGIGIERIGFRPILGTTKLNEIFVSLGLIYLLQNSLAYVFTDDWRYIRSPYEKEKICVGSICLPTDYIAIILITFAILFQSEKQR